MCMYFVFLWQEATLSFDFSVQSERDSALSGGQWDEDQEELEPFRTVLVIPQDRIEKIMDKLGCNLKLDPDAN